MSYTRDQLAYFDYLVDSVVPGLLKKDVEALDRAAIDLKWSARKAKSGEIDAATYCEITKPLLASVCANTDSGDSEHAYARDVLLKLDNFFGVEVAPPAFTDLNAVLEKKAVASGEKDLDWNKSIVDLLKILGVDSSFGNRKKIAMRLGYTEDRLEAEGSGEMNIWLHDKFMVALANHGGEIPEGLA